MKIALITIHYHNNYGAVLQAFATQKVLSQYGEVKIINYFNRHLQYELDLIRFKPSAHILKMIARDILLIRDRNRFIKRFKGFIKSKMNLSKLVTRHDLENGAMDDFDMYVCGSDQIWNVRYNFEKTGEVDPIYFLSFLSRNAKKISYASSMGEHYHLADSERKKVKSLLKDFVTISVRESDAQEMLSELLEREVFHVLDPTLLLPKEEWLKALGIEGNDRSQKEEYILVYNLCRTPWMKKTVEFIVNKLRKKIVIIDQSFKPVINTTTHIRDAGPVEFVELFSNASFVITDSFHGSCFSLNFGKPFVPVRPWRDGNRITSLLNLFGLKERFIKKEQDIYKLNIDFDYELLEKKLKDERERSMKILSSSIASA